MYTKCEGFRNALTFGLLEALLGRRSRRFFWGAEIPDGPLAFKSRHREFPLSEVEKLLVLTACCANTSRHHMIFRAERYRPYLSNYAGAAGGRTFPSAAGFSYEPDLFLPTMRGSIFSMSVIRRLFRGFASRRGRTRAIRTGACFRTPTNGERRRPREDPGGSAQGQVLPPAGAGENEGRSGSLLRKKRELKGAETQPQEALRLLSVQQPWPLKYSSTFRRRSIRRSSPAPHISFFFRRARHALLVTYSKSFSCPK